MRKLLYIFLFIPIVVIGQHDFETRYFTIDAKALPEVAGLTELPFAKKDFFINKLPTFRVTPDNYWQAVDMVSVLDEKQVYLNPQLNMPVISSRKFGFSVQVGEINSFDGTSNKGIRNIAYKEQRSYYFCGLRGIPAANQ